MKLQIKPGGEVVVTTPSRTSLKRAQFIIESSRQAIRELRQKSLIQKHPVVPWQNGTAIGSSHTLQLIENEKARLGSPQARTIDQKLIISSHPQENPLSLKTFIDDHAKKILRTQAKAYLGRRLETLASRMDCHYEKVRYSNASTRWGSCSSEGTISLNIWLMTLPKELIDYVLVHELSHTKHMNHSTSFWQHVEEFEPNYKQLRRELKKFSPMP